MDVPMPGYQMLVRGEVFRAKFRDSYSDPEPLVPGEISSIRYAMPDIAHTFKQGHRIMVQVQSSWFPLVDRNPQKFVDIYNASEEDFQIATQTVHRSEENSSFIEVLILKN
jgi:predicted acyl esterase